MILQETLMLVRDDLDAVGRPWALVGGLAVSVHTEPRFTRDIDVAVLVASDPEADEVVHALFRKGYQPYASMDQTETGRLATERLWSPKAPTSVSVDLRFASSGLEAEITASAQRLEVLPGLILPVARVEHLVVLKLLSTGPERPRDIADLEQLRRVLGANDVVGARAACRLVVERGTHRGRDLPQMLEDLLGGDPGCR